MNWKSIAVTSAIVLGVMAVVARVEPLRKIVTGA